MITRITSLVRQTIRVRIARHREGRNWRRIRQHWLINVGVGLVILGVCRGLGGTLPVEIVENAALDMGMSFRANVWPTPHDDVPRLVSIDVDEDTWRDPDWGGGAPTQAPRGPLLRLIEYAAKQGARFIVVDIIIEGNTHEDQLFADAVAALVSKPELVSKSDLHILFVRTILRETEEDPQPEWRFSTLDKVMDDAATDHRLHAVAPYFRVSRDGVLREWKMWEIACSRRDDPLGRAPGTWRVLPSAQLAVALLAGSSKFADRHFLTKLEPNTRCGRRILEGKGAAEVRLNEPPSVRERERDAIRSEARDAREEFEKHLPRFLSPGELGEGLQNRILFSFGASAPAEVAGHVRALDILRGLKDGIPMAGAVVVIGQSFDEARDKHATPVGLLPGPLVLLNSIDSAIHVGPLSRIPWPIDYAVEIALIIGVGFVFAFFHSAALAAFLLRLFLLPLFVVATHAFAEHTGQWWDYGLPLVGIGLHRWFDSILESVKKHRDRQKQRSNIMTPEEHA